MYKINSYYKINEYLTVISCYKLNPNKKWYENSIILSLLLLNSRQNYYYLLVFDLIWFETKEFDKICIRVSQILLFIKLILKTYFMSSFLEKIAFGKEKFTKRGLLDKFKFFIWNIGLFSIAPLLVIALKSDSEEWR